MKETNMEHFRGEIEESEYGYDFGVENGKLIVCGGFCYNCKCCDLSNEKNPNDGLSACMDRKLKWLMSEYKPEPVLTAREKHFVEFAQEGWLARDDDGGLWWYEDKPIRACMTKWSYRKFAKKLSDKPYKFEQCFRFITWEDEEPWAVEELRKLKVKAGDQDET